ELDRLASEDRNYGATVLLAKTRFPFRNVADLDRLLDGLRKAGLPELPLGYDWDSKDRLTGDEIKALLFGHQTLGKQLKTGQSYSRTTTLDGTATILVGDHPPDQGISHMEGDTICTSTQAIPRYCSAIFRNPGGSFEAKNEYVFINPWNHLEFSVVK